MKKIIIALSVALVILLILASQYFNWPGAIHPGGVMLCIESLRCKGISGKAYNLIIRR
mgnify:CR=1 FL=1